MNNQENSEGEIEVIVHNLEMVRDETNFLPSEDQITLRNYLHALGKGTTRDRVISLLNPSGKNVVELSDQELQESYTIVQKNNYWKLPRPGPTRVVFDASHGYYVMPIVKPLM